MKLFRVLYYRILLPLKSMISQLWGQWSFRFHHVSVGKNVTIAGRMMIVNNGKISIGNNVEINSAIWANPIGGSPRTCLKTFSTGMISIGDGSGLSNTAIVSAESVTIGKDVMIGADCRIYDTDFHPLETLYRTGVHRDDSKMRSHPIVIDDKAFIGAGTIILKGTRIGKSSIIGAGSVVSGIVPDGEIWVGNPAHKVRAIQDSVEQ